LSENSSTIAEKSANRGAGAGGGDKQWLTSSLPRTYMGDGFTNT
jgi:hypothetical protein